MCCEVSVRRMHRGPAESGSYDTCLPIIKYQECRQAAETLLNVQVRRDPVRQGLHPPRLELQTCLASNAPPTICASRTLPLVQSTTGMPKTAKSTNHFSPPISTCRSAGVSISVHA